MSLPLSLPRANPSYLHHLPLKSSWSVQILGLPNFVLALLLCPQFFSHDMNACDLSCSCCAHLSSRIRKSLRVRWKNLGGTSFSVTLEGSLALAIAVAHVSMDISYSGRPELAPSPGLAGPAMVFRRLMGEYWTGLPDTVGRS